MTETLNRPLRVFLCHAREDKPAVRKLYKRLKAEVWIDPWLDEEKLLPGMDWDLEIYKAIREADAIIVCLSKESVAKEGYVQKEFKRALSLAEEKPEGTIYIIPLRLNDCTPPVKFQQWQWVNYFDKGAQEKLLKALRLRSDGLKLKVDIPKPAVPETPKIDISKTVVSQTKIGEDVFPKNLSRLEPDQKLDLYNFIKIPSRAVPQNFWIGKYPITNGQYERFLKADDFASSDYWTGFPKFDVNCKQTGDWGEKGSTWLKEKLKDLEHFPPHMWKVEPRWWKDSEFGIAKPDHPVVGVNWFEANAYCKWLRKHWKELDESHANPGLHPLLIRLPLEIEWGVAAGGDQPKDRCPWDTPGQDVGRNILKRANIAKKVGHTTPVYAYPDGKSPFGVMDMVGNVWEWQANFSDKENFGLVIRGSCWNNPGEFARVNQFDNSTTSTRSNYIGFRVVVIAG